MCCRIPKIHIYCRRLCRDTSFHALQLFRKCSHNPWSSEHFVSYKRTTFCSRFHYLAFKFLPWHFFFFFCESLSSPAFFSSFFWQPNYFQVTFSSSFLTTMSSSSERTPNTTRALLPIDDRLVTVSESAESSRSATVSEQRVEPESRAVGPSEDEATQCRNLLSDTELGIWGQGF